MSHLHILNLFKIAVTINRFFLTEKHLLADQFTYFLSIASFYNDIRTTIVYENDIIVNLIIITNVLTKPYLNIKLVYNSTIKEDKHDSSFNSKGKFFAGSPG